MKELLTLIAITTAAVFGFMYVKDTFFTTDAVGVPLRTFNANQLNATYSGGEYLTTDASGLLSWGTPAGGAGASSTLIEIDGVSVNAGVPTLDFDGTDFSITESPTDDFDISVSDNITFAIATATTGFIGALTGNVTGNLTGNVTGNADTATALAANGANCSAGNSPLGVDASGAVESCFDVWTEAENTAAGYVDGSGAAGQAAFFTDSDTLSGDNSFYWNNTDKRLGLGTTSPAEILHIYKSSGNFTTSRWDSGLTQGYMYAYDGDDSFNLGTLSDSDFIFKQNNITRGYIDDANGNWYIQNGEGDDTIFNITAPSAQPEEATLTLTLDEGSGNTVFADLTVEDFAGLDRMVSLNSAAAGANTPLPMAFRFWDSDLGPIANFGTTTLIMDPSGSVNFVNASSSRKTDGSTLLYGANTTVTDLLLLEGTGDDGEFVVQADGKVGIGNQAPSEILHISKPTGQFTTIRYDSGTTQGYFFSYDGDNSVNIGSNSNSTVNMRVNNTTVASFTSSLLTLVSGMSMTIVDGLLDVGGGSLEIPNGTNPTTDSVAEIALDTTDNQLIVDDGTNDLVYRGEDVIFKVTIASTSDAFVSGGIVPIPPEKDGFSLTKYRCYVSGGTSVVLNVSDGTNDTETITCGTTLTSDDDVATNDTFTAGELAELQFGTITGTVNYVTFTAYGYWTRE